MAQAPTPVWAGLDGHLSPYKLIICDLWGVMHNGLALFPEAVSALQQARAAGLQTVFLTNAPKPATIIKSQLLEKGMPDDLRDHVISSGHLARQTVRQQFAGAQLYHMGPDLDHQAVEGLPVTLTNDIGEADCIFASGLDFKRAEDHIPLLESALARDIPFLCANPDRVVHVGNRLWICAGAVADLYADMGGTVHWFGKPTPDAFTACIQEAGLRGHIQPSEVLVIGDSLLTDIAGAGAAGHDSLLITSGIHRDSFTDMTQEIHWPALCGLPEGHSQPTFVMEWLRWAK